MAEKFNDVSNQVLMVVLREQESTGKKQQVKQLLQRLSVELSLPYDRSEPMIQRLRKEGKLTAEDRTRVYSNGARSATTTYVGMTYEGKKSILDEISAGLEGLESRIGVVEDNLPSSKIKLSSR